MNDITKILKIKYPIIQGSMARISTHELVIAVSNAGGLGVLTTVGLNKNSLINEIKKIREKTTKPFGVNLMLMDNNIEELVETIIEQKIEIVFTGAGTPKKYMPKFLENKIKVIPVVPSVKIAKKMEDLGAIAVVAEGMESGGHIGEMTTMALVPQIVSKVSIPVIAAGGIGNGKGMLAALSLGAKGIQMGTFFLVAEENPVHKNYKNAILKAEDTSTIVTGIKTKEYVRTIKNEMTNKYKELENQNNFIEISNLTKNSLSEAVYKGDIDNGSVMAGQIAGIINKENNVKNMIEELIEEYNKALSELHTIK